MRNEKKFDYTNQSDESLDQELRRKKYAMSFIRKKTFGLIAFTILIVLGLIYALIQQRKLLVLKQTFRLVENSEAVTRETFDGYKTVLSIATFNMLADKFERRDGVIALESDPMRKRLRIKFDTTLITKTDIARVLYTKAKLPVTYPSCTQAELTTLRLWISNYYDSYDGLIIRNMLAKIDGIYYIESEFENRPYLDIIINNRADIDKIIDAIQAQTGYVMDKNQLKKLKVNYIVDKYLVINGCKPVEQIRKSILPEIDIRKESTSKETQDSILLAVEIKDIFEIKKLRRLFYQSNLENFGIYAIKTIPDSLPLIKVCFTPKPGYGKAELVSELNNPSLITKTKHGSKTVTNNFRFNPVNQTLTK